MALADYEIEPEKKFPWGWVIGGIFMLLFAGCSYAFIGIFKNIGEAKPINDAFIARVLNDQLPPVADREYSAESGITDEAIAPVNRMIATLGIPDEIGATNCSANSNASTNELSGEFVSCSGSVSYAISPASLATKWRKEEGVWKLLQFNLNVADADAYADLVAEQKKATTQLEDD